MSAFYSHPAGRIDSARPDARGGFTLIELLVVIGLIAVLAAGIGIAMKDGSPSSALRAGQNSLVSMISSARGQAAIKQTNAMIVVDVTTDTSGGLTNEYLRALQVVVQRGAGWEAVGDPILLPDDIYIVPPGDLGGVQMDPSWPSDRKSRDFDDTTASALTPAEPDYDPFQGRRYLKFCTFSPLGKTSTPGVLLITSGRRQGPDAVLLDKPEMIRGITISRYGVPTFINEADTLQFVTSAP